MTDPAPSSRRRGCTIALTIFFVLASAALCVVCAVPYGAARMENASLIALSEVGPSWQVQGDPERSAQLVAADVLRDCQPMGNGIAVLFHHVWYNTLTSGYDDRLWLEGPQGTYDSFGLYMWSNRIFLRDETSQNGYNNQVLVCDRSQWEW